MKHTVSPHFVILILAASFAIAGAEKAAALSPVTIRAIVKDDSPKPDRDKDKKKDKDKGPKVDIEVKSLAIEVRNSGKEPIDATLKYWFFGLKDSDTATTILKEAEESLSLPSGETAKVETEKVTMKYTRRGYQEQEDKDTGIKRRVKVESGGERYRGYGLRIEKDGEILAEYFSSPTYKQIVATE